MKNDDQVEVVLAQFPPACQTTNVRSLGGAGGFSGACFWKLAAERGTLCLRRWPASHPSLARLEFIHGLLQHVAEREFFQVPVPIQTLGSPRRTCLKHAGHLWELTPWMPGNADYAKAPSRRRLQAATKSLARFHRAAADFATVPGQCGPPPVIAERLKLIGRWRGGDLDRLAAAMVRPGPANWIGLRKLGREIVTESMAQVAQIHEELNQVANRIVPIQPCIRDIWEQHILYEGDKVSGIVDFGAARPDTVSTDLVRLLGSLVGDDLNGWKTGMDAYIQMRPLAENELLLINSLDRSSVLLSGLNWLGWIYLENRTFSQKQVIEERLGTILNRLKNAAVKHS